MSKIHLPVAALILLLCGCGFNPGMSGESPPVVVAP